MNPTHRAHAHRNKSHGRWNKGGAQSTSTIIISVSTFKSDDEFDLVYGGTGVFLVCPTIPALV